MQNVLPRSVARAYTVSDDASADQGYGAKSKGFPSSDTLSWTEFNRIDAATENYLI